MRLIKVMCSDSVHSHARVYKTDRKFSKHEEVELQHLIRSLSLRLVDSCEWSFFSLAGKPKNLKRFDFIWRIIILDRVCSWTPNFGVVKRVRGYPQNPWTLDVLNALSFLNIFSRRVSGLTIEIVTTEVGMKIAEDCLWSCLNRIRVEDGFSFFEDERFTGFSKPVARGVLLEPLEDSK